VGGVEKADAGKTSDVTMAKKSRHEENVASHSPSAHIGLINFLILKKRRQVRFEEEKKSKRKRKGVEASTSESGKKVLFPEYKFLSLPSIV
jgi:hypothetical protein